MKRKLTAYILAIALMASLSVPAFAADCRTPVRVVCGNELLWQLLCRYGGFCDGRSTQAKPETPSASGQPAQPEPETPPAPGQPAQPKPETPPAPGQPVQPKPETPPAGASSSVRAYELEVVRLVNAERAKNGLAALTEVESLSDLARLKSRDMRDLGYFDHTSPTYGSPFQMMRSFGVSYRAAGENIAMGYATPQAVVNAWMNSPGHRANILNAKYAKIGVGYVAEGNYWTQEFIG